MVDIPKKGKPVTLCLLIKGDEVLLAMKKRGFGEGKWNGVGGKVGEGEGIEEAAVREAQEEIGVTPKRLEHVATVYYKPFDLKMWTYLVKDWEGEPKETEEMAPKWFKKDNLPDEMWEADKLWLPSVLGGKKIEAVIVYGENNKVLEHSIDVIEE